VSAKILTEDGVLSAWHPHLSPLYAIKKSYLENAEHGPFFEGVIPERPRVPAKKWKDFLGFKIASCIGVPAGPLLNARWISLAAKLGYDVLCYKTIRSHAYEGHQLPNVIFVQGDEQLIPGRLPAYLQSLDHPPSCLEKLAITNSFGMPSRSQEYLKEDIPAAQHSLSKGQVMIVSVVGTPPKTSTDRAFNDDFVEAARSAKQWGASIIEANFSCPNVTTGEGCIYYNPETIETITKSIVQAIAPVPLVIKMGIFPDKALMGKAITSAARSGARAISGINTISMPVYNTAGKPALGEERSVSGICGSPIREAALDFIREARNIIDRGKLELAILGCGGITLPEHFDFFINAGADIAMTATGMMWDPCLALRYHRR
jgi:dihydroorotate dehydrogenase (NAD+) catalytic subunit